MKKNLYVAIAQYAGEKKPGKYQHVFDAEEGLYNATVYVYEDGTFGYTAEPAIVED